MKEKILEVLGRFASIQRATLVSEVLYRNGNYSLAREKELDAALVSLLAEGKIIGRGLFDWFRLAPRAPESAPVAAAPPVQTAPRRGRIAR